ncbi:mitochondrial import inner membrane translocase subunit tim54 [Malassezia equina]|uniref:Mitochondrial import inner membrane translocase subunit TIM54 n=1 Tax=Malassezia equina TaxID=1381935 RepID=A0AAF0IYU7_9BASI|nr:mitochondrial import inner membrane translocase subunit tim54 [Malassezia equina]
MTGSAKPTEPPREIPKALRPLVWVGIPEAALKWKPRLPSRNWSIFLTSVAALTYLYYDDRRQCKKIMEEYKERVRGLSEEVVHPLDHPRKVHVYTAKYPGDDNYDVGVRYFKRYVKPILVAAAVDYEITSGTKYGNLARELCERIHERRRNLAGLEPWTTNTVAGTSLPTTLSPAQFLQRELDGAVVLIGRPAYKEWAWALREGWGTSIPSTRVDRDEQLASVLSEDSTFEEQVPEPKSDIQEEETEEPAQPVATQGFMLPSQVGLQSLQHKSGKPSFAAPPTSIVSQAQPETPSAPTEPEQLLPPVAPIPAQPPICFVDFTNLVGWRNIPRRIVHFFNHRSDARLGAEAGLSIVLGTKNDAREFEPGMPGSAPNSDGAPLRSDLDWGVDAEQYYPRSFDRTLQDIARYRKDYYGELQKELQATREIQRGVREPTKYEQRNPPRSEIELRSERFDREKMWRNSEHGYDILKPSAPVSWDESWRGSLRVLQPRSKEERVPRKLAPRDDPEEPVATLS